MALELLSVSKRFGREAVLSDVSLAVAEGTCVGLLGQNGAGKTTLLRIALGLSRPSRGSLRVDGLDPERAVREVRRLMGGLVETPGFHDGMGARSNLVRLARLSGFSREVARQEAERVLERVGLEGVGEKPLRAWSLGMRQRLGIAQALLGGPRYLLLDEPTNALDLAGIALVRGLCSDLVRDEGVGVLVSSHRLAELEGLATHLVVLGAGRVLAAGPVSRLLGDGSRYTTRVAREDRARAALLSLGIEARATREHGALELALGGWPAAQVLAELVRSGASPSDFTPRRRSLEEVCELASRGALEVESAAPEARAPAPRPKETEVSRGGWARVVRDECTRVYAGRLVHVALLAAIAVGPLAVLQRSLTAQGEQADVARGVLYSTTEVGAHEGVGLALRTAAPLLALLHLGLASQSLAGELARGTLRNALLRPLTRAEVACGKFIAQGLLALASYAAVVCAALAASALFLEFGDVAEALPNGGRFVLVEQAELTRGLATTLAILAPALLGVVALGFLAGALARSAATGLAWALGFFACGELARGFLAVLGVARLSPLAHWPGVTADGSRLSGYLDASRGASNASTPELLASLAVPLATVAAAAFLSSWILQRRSIP